MPELLKVYMNKSGNKPQTKNGSHVNVTHSTKNKEKDKNMNEENDFTNLLE